MENDINPLVILNEQLKEIMRSSIQYFPQIMAAALFLLIIWGIKRSVVYAFDKGTLRSSMRPSLRDALRTLISIGMWLSGLLLAAMIAMPGLTPARLLAGLGVGSIAVGLAFKDIFENFLSGILILMRKPMRIGDYIECEGIEGQVKQISIRDTYIRRMDGVLIMVPNGFLYKNALLVLTDWPKRRVTFICGIAYGENVDKAREVIVRAVMSVESVIKDMPIEIFARSFGSSSIDFEVTWWTKSKPVDVRRSRDNVVAAVKHGLDAAGVEIPFPYRTLTFKEPVSFVDSTHHDKAAADRS